MAVFNYLQQAKKVRMYYDLRGQVVKTINPDGAEQRIVFGVSNITKSIKSLSGNNFKVMI